MNTLIEIAVYSSLALFLFVGMNFIGRHSISFGYTQITLYGKADEAPGFNFVFRVISPVIYIFVLSAILYESPFPQLVTRIWLVVAIYFSIRFSYTILFGRTWLINWRRFFLTAISSLLLTYVAFKYIIIPKKNIIPDYGNISNEMWALIIVYVLSVFNKLRFSEDALNERKTSYLKNKLSKFRARYSKAIAEIVAGNLRLELIIYSIMLYENFNRPYFARLVEYALFPLRLSKTLGIMQVRTEKYINDEASVSLGAKLVVNSFKQHVTSIDMSDGFYPGEYSLIRKIIADYNRDDNYVEEVISILNKVEDLVPGGKQATLLSKKPEAKKEPNALEQIASFFKGIIK